MGLVPSPTVLSVDEMGRIAPPIFTSVGRGGANAPGDVFVIQSLLNDRLPKPHAPIPVNGVADVGTTLAIEAYQAVIMQMTPPSGRVDPGSSTYYSLAARPLVANCPANLGRPFRRDPVRRRQCRGRLAPALDRARVCHGGAVGGGERLGSLHAARQQQSVRHQGDRRPAGGGEPHSRGDQWRERHRHGPLPGVRFSIAQAFDEHGRLLATASVYRNAMNQKDNPEAFADALTGVYATDPNYGFTLKWVMEHYGLTQYDR